MLQKTKLVIAISILSSFIACKEEASYVLKEPFGEDTMSIKADEFEDQAADTVKLNKKNFDRQKYDEKMRYDRAIDKILTKARKWDPNQVK